MAAVWVHEDLFIYEDLMQSICKHPEHTFIKMALLKIDFYFEVFKQPKNYLLSYPTGAT